MGKKQMLITVAKKLKLELIFNITMTICFYDRTCFIGNHCIVIFLLKILDGEVNPVSYF